jgi:hypothetical protein
VKAWGARSLIDDFLSDRHAALADPAKRAIISQLVPSQPAADVREESDDFRSKVLAKAHRKMPLHAGDFLRVADGAEGVSESVCEIAGDSVAPAVPPRSSSSRVEAAVAAVLEKSGKRTLAPNAAGPPFFLSLLKTAELKLGIAPWQRSLLMPLFVDGDREVYEAMTRALAQELGQASGVRMLD